MEKMLKDSLHGEFFSGTNEMGAVDVVLYFQISTIIKICSTNGSINEQQYPTLVPWIHRMHDE